MFYNIPKRFAVPMLPEHVYPVMPFFGSLPDSHDHEDHAWLREPCSRIRNGLWTYNRPNCTGAKYVQSSRLTL
jgi:hypothetical protein